MPIDVALGEQTRSLAALALVTLALSGCVGPSNDVTWFTSVLEIVRNLSSESLVVAFESTEYAPTFKGQRIEARLAPGAIANNISVPCSNHHYSMWIKVRNDAGEGRGARHAELPGCLGPGQPWELQILPSPIMDADSYILRVGRFLDVPGNLSTIRVTRYVNDAPHTFLAWVGSGLEGERFNVRARPLPGEQTEVPLSIELPCIVGEHLSVTLDFTSGADRRADEKEVSASSCGGPYESWTFHVAWDTSHPSCDAQPIRDCRAVHVNLIPDLR